MAARVQLNRGVFIASFSVWILLVVTAAALAIYQFRDQRSPVLSGLTSLRTRVLQTAEIRSLPDGVIEVSTPINLAKEISTTDVSATDGVVASNAWTVTAGAGRTGSFLEAVNRLGTAQWSTSVTRDTIVVHGVAEPVSNVNGLVVFAGGKPNVVVTPVDAPVFDTGSGAILAKQTSRTPMFSFRDAEDTGFNFNGTALGVWATHVACPSTVYIKHNPRSDTFFKSFTFSGTANTTVTLIQLLPFATGSAYQGVTGAVPLASVHVELFVTGLLQTSSTNRSSMCVQTMWQGDVSRTAFSNLTLGRTTVAYSLVEPTNLVAIVAGAATAGGLTRGVRVTLISTAVTTLSCTAQIRVTYISPIDDPVLGLRLIPEFI